ncbi:Gfo/Idh/MocA family protein [Leptothrix discophora]|uniref:Gfo/Idh/MocA family oxidoreductase n=1 Tax=Leptothrix discophora TaxID=89 RepID=A0ABT9FYH7_LEPDI|nr:Gfo/Idh/MocA family oxidoreductase [Leptothrix discophora]MDP4299277.1 Gfo/Idh/MocA family oxidoreductase [Leptothrix discophora]
MTDPIPVRYGLIGSGMMGQEHLRNIALLPGVSVSRIYEPDDGMAQASLALAPGARRVGSLAEVVDSPEVDGLLVASPNFRHAEQLREIATRRPLPVLLEKPACTTLDNVRALASLQRSYPAPLWVAMEYRYMPPVARLIEAVHGQQVLGPLVMLAIREHRFPFLVKVGDWNRFNRYTGGTLVEKCCHFFDLMRHLVRSEPVRIYASASMAHNHRDERYPDGVPDILDNAFVTVDFAGGQRAVLDLCMFAEGSRYQEEISAVGPLGKVECFVPGPGRFWPAHLGAPPLPRLVLSPREPKGPRELEVPVDPVALAAGDHNGSTLEQHQRFVKAVRGQGGVEVGLRDGLAAVVMGLAAQASAQTGQAIDLRRGEHALPALLDGA